ncbi:MAG: NAD(P)H-hydrate epimerase [Anaerolineales bacterium]
MSKEQPFIPKLVSVEQMRQIEAEANARGLTYDQMMQNAGEAVAKLVQRLAQENRQKEGWHTPPTALGLVGSGNNGGDTLVALTRLAQEGWETIAYLVKERKKGKGTDPLVTHLLESGGKIFLMEQDPHFQHLGEAVQRANVILDGLLGTGITLPLRTEISLLLDAVQSFVRLSPRLIVAVDCPSGVDCDSGEVSPSTLHADYTLTLGAVKQGLLKLPAFTYLGRLEVADIGFSEDLPTMAAIRDEVADLAFALHHLPERPPEAHKGTFGTALIVAGSLNYTGAALLAGQGAYAVGAGLVTLAVPSPLHAALAGHLPEATWLLLPHELGVIDASAAEVILENLGRTTAILLGPGFGLEETTREFIENLLTAPAPVRKPTPRIGFLAAGEPSTPQPTPEAVKLPPLIVDADGLKLLARLPNWWQRLPGPAVLTPHPGEMSILCGLPVAEIQASRLETARRFAAEWGHVIVLKGAFTVIAAPDGRTTTIPIATSALAHGGSGDLLAGMITGLRAQGLEAYDAARLGAWLHAQAGLEATRDLAPASVLASDVLTALRKLLRSLEDQRQARHS